MSLEDALQGPLVSHRFKSTFVSARAKRNRMTPIVGRRQHVNKEAGLVMEGEILHFSSLERMVNGVLDWSRELVH